MHKTHTYTQNTATPIHTITFEHYPQFSNILVLLFVCALFFYRIHKNFMFFFVNISYYTHDTHFPFIITLTHKILCSPFPNEITLLIEKFLFFWLSVFFIHSMRVNYSNWLIDGDCIKNGFVKQNRSK